MGVSYLGCTTRCGRIRRWAIQATGTASHLAAATGGMGMWKTLRVSHIPTPPAATTDKCPTRRYTNTPLGTKDRSGQMSNICCTL
jgi:hypothetical protein